MIENKSGLTSVVLKLLIFGKIVRAQNPDIENCPSADVCIDELLLAIISNFLILNVFLDFYVIKNLQCLLYSINLYFYFSPATTFAATAAVNAQLATNALVELTIQHSAAKL